MAWGCCSPDFVQAAGYRSDAPCLTRSAIEGSVARNGDSLERNADLTTPTQLELWFMKNPHAVALGRLGGPKGAMARAKPVARAPSRHRSRRGRGPMERPSARTAPAAL